MSDKGGHRALVNVATGEFYCSKQRRLVKSLTPFINGNFYFDRWGENGDWSGRNINADYIDGAPDLLTWIDVFPINSKLHPESPYGFKIHSMDAARLLGYTSILWTDSPAWAVKRPAPIFEKMEKEGYYVMSHTDPLCNSVGEDILEKFQVTRDQLNREGLNLPSGSCYGFDLTHPKGKVLFENMLQHEKEGLFFSKDGRHRHDEAILALNMRRLGFPVFFNDPLFQSDSPECVIKSGDGQPE